MQAIIIADASCIILLEKIGELQLLHSMFEKVTITPEVAKEVQQELPEWFVIQEVKNLRYQKLLEESLDSGEASAIALAFEQGNCLLIIDEVKGRKLARHLDIPFTGTLGILIEAKQAGLIPSIKPFLEKIRMTNFRLTKSLEREALNQAGEE